MARRRFAIMGGGAALIVLGGLALRWSVWPAALLIRSVFDCGGRRTAARLAPLVPAGVSAVLDEPYRSGDPDARLDVFRPSGATAPLPTVVWVHGGGWLSGDKAHVAAYLQLLAAEGFTTVGVNYSIAPGRRYPVPVGQVADALGHVVRAAHRLGVDPARLVLAGDSAGSHIAAQVANAITDPRYARALGVTAPVRRDQLRGLVLFCGPYDLGVAAATTGMARMIMHTFAWAYSGRRMLLREQTGEELFSVARHVSGAFPPTFLSVGNADPLRPHSELLADRLRTLGTPVDTVFYPADHEPRLGHEYQFDLRLAEARDVFARMVGFLRGGG